jgi:hypothetical protein
MVEGLINIDELFYSVKVFFLFIFKKILKSSHYQQSERIFISGRSALISVHPCPPNKSLAGGSGYKIG